ncbi:hypothetical protein SDC9_196982 [bioreactor metagenome]|uniref:Uncharacterized protein n=1 Tax=bioreactor metagenome TaxID=1076179 RepID=A0A645IEV3_9ZZZZ
MRALGLDRIVHRHLVLVGEDHDAGAARRLVGDGQLIDDGVHLVAPTQNERVIVL